MTHKIEWLNRPGTTGVSWNPIQDTRKGPSGRGYHCTKISPGCAKCWAETMNKRFGNKQPFDDSPVEFELLPKVLAQPLHWQKPRTVTVQLMGDLFHEDVSDEFIMRVFGIIDLCRKANDAHTFLMLTKRPQRMLEFVGHWFESDKHPHTAFENLWLGVTVENPDYLWRIDELLRTPAAVRFVSVEPMLSGLDLRDPLNGYPEQVSERTYVTHDIAMDAEDMSMMGTPMSNDEWAQTMPALDWVICGAETGPGARLMRVDWARNIRDQCGLAGVPFLFKKPSPGTETPPDLEIREWPEV